MPFFENGGIAFHYLDTGAGMPFLFQHGLGGDTLQARGAFQPPLPFRLLTLDCRGHGETRPLGEVEGLSFTQFADDLRALLDHLAVPRAVVGGISMGAGAALTFALRYPERVRALVLARPAWLDQPLPGNLRLYPRIAALIREQGAAQGRETFLRSPECLALLASHPAAAASLLKQFERRRAEETAALLERLPNDAPSLDRRDWETIRVPTLVLGSDRDPIHPLVYAETLAQAIPGARLARITSKELDPARHARDIQYAVEEFFEGLD